MASSSDSLTPSPPAPGAEEQVGQADEAPDTNRTGQGSARRRTRWEREQRRPLGVLDGPVLGHRLGQDEDHHHLEDGGGDHPHGPNQRSARMPTRVAVTSWLMRTRSSTGLRNPSGSWTRRIRTRPPPAVVLQGHGLGPAHPDQARLGQGQPAETSSRSTTTTDQDPVGGRSREAAATMATATATPPPGGSGPAARARVVPCARPPRRHRGPCPTGAASRGRPGGPSRRRTVTPWSTALRAATAGQTTTSPSRTGMSSSSVRRRRARSPLVGRAAARLGLVVDGKGQHVGGARSAEEPLAQLGDGGLVHEEQRDLDVVLHALGLEHVAGQLGEAPMSTTRSDCSSAAKTSAHHRGGLRRSPRRGLS
jgi:hypothetical protein